MKRKKVIIACIVTLLLTWLSITTIAYMLSSVTDFTTCATNHGTMMFMLIIGWMPALIVCCELYERYEIKN